MAEVKNQKSGADDQTSPSKAKELVATVGYLLVTSFLSGLALAAGGHAWNATARSFGGNPGGSVSPLKRVV